MTTVYITYLNKAKNFAEDKKVFTAVDAYDQALLWGKEHLSNFHPDMIHYAKSYDKVYDDLLEQMEDMFKLLDVKN